MRSLATGAVVIFVVVAILQITLACSVWRWPAAIAFIVYPTFAIIAIGSEESRPEISSLARGLAVWLCTAAILSGIATAVGFFC